MSELTPAPQYTTVGGGGGGSSLLLADEFKALANAGRLDGTYTVYTNAVLINKTTVIVFVDNARIPANQVDRFSYVYTPATGKLTFTDVLTDGVSNPLISIYAA